MFIKKIATWLNLDIRVKPEYDNIGADTLVKFENNSICTGRSMVEMLGVLAIIGVLSVGAIAGYSKAMFKYKLNKQTEQLNQVIGAITRYKSSLLLNPNPANTPTSDYQLVPILKKLGEIPKEMYTSVNEYIKDSFGVEYHIYNRNTEKSLISLRTYNLGRDESSFQICKNLYLIAKEWHKEINVIMVVAYKGNTFSSKGWCCGDDYIVSDCTMRIKDLQLSDLDDICRTATEEQGDYSIMLRF